MSTLMIHDLPLHSELAQQQMRTVRGGSNFAFVGGQSITNVGRGSILAVNAPSVSQTDYHPSTRVDLDIANVAFSRNSGVFQA